MKRLIPTLLLFFIFISCNKDDIPNPSDDTRSGSGEVEQTLFMYMPWSTNLTNYFYKNVSDMEKSVSSGALRNDRVLVFFQTTSTHATLFELIYDNGSCKRDTLKTYTNPAVTTAGGITSFLNDVKEYAPAKRYAMAINCHGMGWIPVSGTKAYARGLGEKEYWEYEEVPQTRYFGGLSPEFQTDVTTLAEGIKNAGIKMEYILFDDCYMSSMEVAYDLKDVTGYLVGSTSEVMAHGMPYDQIGQYMIGNINLKGICDGFYSFYSTYSVMPCGTLAVTDCSEMDNMAAVMKKINEQFTFDPSLLSSIQRLDGYTPIRFFDYGDYVAKLCEDPELLAEFDEQLQRTVPYKVHTDTYYTMIMGRQIKINTFSGVTISDPSISTQTTAKTETAWYKATH